jgi:hypothetical protein
MVNTAAQDHCNSVLDHVTPTNLNFVLQETSYSIFITIRKTFVKNAHNPYPPDYLSSCAQTHTPLTETKNMYKDEIIQLKMKVHHSEAEHATVIKT